jgi:hypothetical protein
VVVHLSSATELAVVVPTVALDYVAPLDKLYHGRAPGTLLNLMLQLCLGIDFLFEIFIFLTSNPLVALGHTDLAYVLLA